MEKFGGSAGARHSLHAQLHHRQSINPRTCERVQDRVAESVIAHSTIFAVADAVIGLREAVDEGVHDGLIDRGAGDRWLDGLRAADKNGRFFAALTGFVVAGRTP